MSPDLQPQDLVDQVLRGAVPVSDAPFDVIDARYERLVRRDRRRRAVVVVAALVLAVAILIPLSAQSSKGAVEVDKPSAPRHRSAHRTPTSSAAVHTNTNVSTTTTIVIKPGVLPTLMQPAPAARPAAAVVAPPATVAPARTTTTTIAQPRATTSTTIPVQYPPIQDGDARIIVVLDDAGLHAPATVRVGPTEYLEVLLLDQRSNKSTNPMVAATAYVYTRNASPGAAAWDGSLTPLSAYHVDPGQSYTLQAVDETGANDIPGATATFMVTGG